VQSSSVKRRGPFLKQTTMHYVMYRDTLNEWRWTLFAANSRKIADSGEGYRNESDCLAAIGLVKASANAPVYRR
jgi:uncharacterized protein